MRTLRSSIGRSVWKVVCLFGVFEYRLFRLPVTQEMAGSTPAYTAKRHKLFLCCLPSTWCWFESNSARLMRQIAQRIELVKYNSSFISALYRHCLLSSYIVTGMKLQVRVLSASKHMLHRGIEQLAARQAHNLKAGGSSPPPAIIWANGGIRYTLLSQKQAPKGLRVRVSLCPSYFYSRWCWQYK